MSAGELNVLLGRLQKYRSKGLLVDTNLLLLYLIGVARPDRVTTFKPITNQGFIWEDFERLNRIVSGFNRLITTPHIMTEVSNHLGKTKGQDRHDLCQIIRRLTQLWDERYATSAALSQRDEFAKFGLTDTAISEAAPGRFLVITVDFELTGYLAKKRVDVINFNHLRQLG
jgi:hypothetical protein